MRREHRSGACGTSRFACLLRETGLDKKVVDVSGAKVERVNDIHFLLARDSQLVPGAHRLGMRALVRRLGWQSVVDRLVRAAQPQRGYFSEESLIGWK